MTEHADEHGPEGVIDVGDESEVVNTVLVIEAKGHDPARDAQQEVELHRQQHLEQGTNERIERMKLSSRIQQIHILHTVSKIIF